MAVEGPSRSADSIDGRHHQGASEELAASCGWQLDSGGVQRTAGEAGAPGSCQTGVTAAGQLLQTARAAGNDDWTELLLLQPPPLDARPQPLNSRAATGDAGMERSGVLGPTAEDSQDTPKSKQVKPPNPGQQTHCCMLCGTLLEGVRELVLREGL